MPIQEFLRWYLLRFSKLLKTSMIEGTTTIPLRLVRTFSHTGVIILAGN